MKKLWDLAAVVGTYEKQGETKKQWKTVGGIYETKAGGKIVLLERTFNPAGVWQDPQRPAGKEIFLSMFEPKPKEAWGNDNAPTMSAQQVKDKLSKNQPIEEDGDIPF